NRMDSRLGRTWRRQPRQAHAFRIAGWTLLNCYWVLPGSIGFYQVLQGSFRVLLGSFRVLLGSSELSPARRLLRSAEPRRTRWNLNEPRRTRRTKRNPERTL